MKKGRTTKLVVYPPRFIQIEEEPGIEVHHITSDELFAEVNNEFVDRRIIVLGKTPDDWFPGAFGEDFVIVLTDDHSHIERFYSLGANLVFRREIASIVELVKLIAANVEL